MEEQFIHYQESITSLNRAWRTVCELEKTDSGTAIWAAAYRMALVGYCKPFKRSNGITQKSLRLNVPELSVELNEVHNQVTGLRDKLLAHSDLSSLDPEVYYSAEGTANIIKNCSPAMPSLNELRTLVESVLDYFYKKESEYAPRKKPKQASVVSPAELGQTE